jgi:hypothetical protein
MDLTKDRVTAYPHKYDLKEIRRLKDFLFIELCNKIEFFDLEFDKHQVESNSRDLLSLFKILNNLEKTSETEEINID